MSSRVKDHTPPDILLSNDTMKNILQSFQSQERTKSNSDKYRELTITLSLSLIGCVISFAGAFSAMGMLWDIISGIIIAILLIVMCITAFKWHEATREAKAYKGNSSDIEELFLSKVQETARYTAIIRVTTKIKGEMRYLVGTDYFLPHCSMTIDATLYEQQNNLYQCLHDDFGILEKDIIKLQLLEDKIYYSIKPIHGRVQMNGYAFYDVEIKVQAKAKILELDGRRRWMSLNNMRQTPDALATNKDVIDLLDSFPKPKESFVNLLGDLSIIWNITSSCGYECAICATHDERRQELKPEEKVAVLNSIVTANTLIKSLDFAGGDPLWSNETTNIIQSAIMQLGTDKVSVTTTGDGIKRLMSSEFSFSNLIKRAEITIDAAHANLQSNPASQSNISRNVTTYCEGNIRQIQTLLEHTESLTINIPIINDDLSDDEINTLVGRICEIKEHNPSVEIDTLLIRLMPVGRLTKEITKDIYQNYNPIDVIRKIKTQLESNHIPCKLHCSLRILPCFNDPQCPEHCSMLERKIGIDCAGNVFACAWGGYLYSKEPPTKNPFYLGNLTRVKLIDILNGVSRTQPYRDIMAEINSNQHRYFCSVISYYAGKELFKDADYLSKVCNSQGTRQP